MDRTIQLATATTKCSNKFGNLIIFRSTKHQNICYNGPFDHLVKYHNILLL